MEEHLYYMTSKSSRPRTVEFDVVRPGELSSDSTPLEEFRSLNGEELPSDTNSYRKIASDREYPELNHVHTSGYSDGSGPILTIIEEAFKMGVSRVGLTDHADAGIVKDKEGYYGKSEFSDVESLNEGLKETLESNNSDLPYAEVFPIEFARGMELNYMPGYEEEIKDFISQDARDLDYLILSVHHDSDGRNYGYKNDFSSVEDPESLVDNYYDRHIRAAEFADEIPKIKAIAHFDRIETNPLFVEEVAPEKFLEGSNRFLDAIEGMDVLPELNMKVLLRSIYRNERPTIGGRALLQSGQNFSGGTDTHRKGNSSKVSYKVNESEARLAELEKIAEDNENLTSILEDLDLDNSQRVRLNLTSMLQSYSCSNAKKDAFY